MIADDYSLLHIAMQKQAIEFIVNQSHLPDSKCVPLSLPDAQQLPEGKVLFKINQFAFTSNNVTYAAFGTPMKYWNFFPTEAGWGNIPVWGFADVEASTVDGVQVGERFYGYFPMASHLLVTPVRINAAGFIDGAEHRQEMHGLYNHYLRSSTDPAYTPDSEDAQVLLRPLFITSFMIDDFLEDNQLFGATTVIISSASSKTAYGLAFLLSLRKDRHYRIVGLTSASNQEFVRTLGIYDQVLTYDGIDALPADQGVVYVDMAGNGALRSRLHHHFRDNMKYSCAVGGTHWENLSGAGDLPGARPSLFFAPAQIKKRMTDWGPGGVQTRLAAAWHQLMQPLMLSEQPWMRVIHGSGPEAVQAVYQSMLKGGAAPDEGHVLSLS